MNLTYDAELKKQIQFYEIHPEYMPFVGDRYDEFKILQVGESHFIPQRADEPDLFSITYFEKWWEDSCAEAKNCQQKNCHNEKGDQWGGWFRTKSVIENYMNRKRTRSHGIFTEMVKVFAVVCQNRTIMHINDEESKNYNHFAFMNFFQVVGSNLFIFAFKVKCLTGTHTTHTCRFRKNIDAFQNTICIAFV